MAIDKGTLASLNLFMTAFREARERGANESDMVMYLVKFFEEILGYESLKGEISKEYAIRDRYCDLALKIDGVVRLLVECKPANLRGLVEKHIEQAENYASRAGLRWVVLTNGIDWKLYHLTFAEGEGITHDLALELNFLEEMESSPESAWDKLSLLTRDSVAKDGLEEFWSQRKALAPASLVRVLFTQEVLSVIRRELRREAKALLDIEDVFNGVRDILSKEALLNAGDITFKKRRKRRRRVERTDPTTGETVTEEVEDAAPDDEEQEESSGDLGGMPAQESPSQEKQ